MEGKALVLVSSLDDVDDIWERLKSAYGDAKLLLKRKIGEVDRIAYLWKIRDPEKVAEMLSKLIVMKHLMELAREHDIEARLYSGDGLERIYNLLGDSRLTRWLSQIIEKKLSDKQLWSGLIVFLESDLKVQQQKVLLQNKSDNMKQTQKGDNRFDKKDALSAHHTVESDSNKCYFCDGKDHNYWTKWIENCTIFCLQKIL